MGVYGSGSNRVSPKPPDDKEDVHILPHKPVFGSMGPLRFQLNILPLGEKLGDPAPEGLPVDPGAYSIGHTLNHIPKLYILNPNP